MSKVFQFTLILDGVDDNTLNLEDSLFESGCDDALINYKNGTVFLDFDRESDSLQQAIISAIQDIESAGIGAAVVSVSPEHLVSLSDIAKRISVTRQSLSQMMLGERGDGNFPKPVLKISNKSPLWRWASVAEWLYQHDKIKDHAIVDAAITIEDINSALDMRNEESLKHRSNILNAITQH